MRTFSEWLEIRDAEFFAEQDMNRRGFLQGLGAAAGVGAAAAVAGAEDFKKMTTRQKIDYLMNRLDNPEANKHPLLKSADEMMGGQQEARAFVNDLMNGKADPNSEYGQMILYHNPSVAVDILKKNTVGGKLNTGDRTVQAVIKMYPELGTDPFSWEGKLYDLQIQRERGDYGKMQKLFSIDRSNKLRSNISDYNAQKRK